MVKKATMVWTGNERDQQLLSESALADLIPSFEVAGQQNPAFGREINGIIEVADGSRRRQTAIYTQREYRVLVGELDDEQMAWLSKIGNDYQPTSAFERGKRYARRLQNEFDGNISKLAEAENISRKIISRCVATAELPHDLIALFSSPNDLSARAGEALAKFYKAHEDTMEMVVPSLMQRKQSGEKFDAEELLNYIYATVDTRATKEKKVRTFGAGITATYKPTGVAITLKDAPAALLKKIEALLEQHEKEQQVLAKDEIENSLDTLDRVVKIIRSAAIHVEYKLSDTQLQSLIPLARSAISEKTNEAAWIEKIGDEIVRRFVLEGK
ncbi:virulence regulon transcriptional activator VirB [Komagataeibacter europaeus]|uniref:Virulence regulon transcriptional activator VirB n=1 Tax=Komagataeibacter europaeus TaxID=33995 RepID=A0A0M0ECG1_KOMEU|nr:virulence regulon transcriptional activator VirB [Komagataeibacter europaeus]